MMVRTAQSSGFGCYGFASAENLEDLKRQLRESGHRVVHLIMTDPWDSGWTTHKGDLAVELLSEADLSWLGEPQESMHLSQRYLVCRL